MKQIRINEEPEILFRDEWFYIVLKKREELTVPGRGPGMEECLMSRCSQWFGEVHNVHRLDQPTSGLVIIARTKEAQRAMSILFQEKKVQKEYMALVQGVILENEGLIDLPMRGDPLNRPIQIIDEKEGKKALTKWQVIKRFEEQTKVKLFPQTGRTHQLRLHMRSLGHPIVGDRLYNDDVAEDLMGELKLHASRLVFTHPFTNETVDIFSAEDF